MHGKHERKVRKRILNRTATAILLAIAICVSSIATVMANTVSATVIDGDQVYTFIMSSTDTDDILAEAETMGLNTLDQLDVCERVGNTTTVNVRRGALMNIEESGQTTELVAYQGDTVERTLENNNILLKINDIVQPSRETVVTGHMGVVIQRHSKVTVEADGTTETVELTGCTVADALEKVDIKLGADDTLNYPLDEPLFDGAGIKVSRVLTVKVTADGKTEEHKLSATSIMDALDKLNYELGDKDTVSPPLTAKLKNGQEIVIKRIETKEIEETEVIPFEKKDESDGKLYVGESEVRTQGVNGEKKLKHLVTYTDAAETGKELISETVSLEPITEVTAVGTKEREVVKAPAANNNSGSNNTSNSTPAPSITAPPAPSDSGNTVTDASGNAVGYSSMISGKGTAYCDTGLTASGHQAGYDYVAVNPNLIPYGTRLYVRSSDGAYERYCIASDTGGNLLNGNVLIDVWFPTESECRSFGVRTMEVYFIG